MSSVDGPERSEPTSHPPILSIVARGRRWPEACQVDPVRRPLGRLLDFFLVVDYGELRRFVSAEDLDRWGLDEAEAWDAAGGIPESSPSPRAVRRPLAGRLSAMLIGSEDITWLLYRTDVFVHLAGQAVGPQTESSRLRAMVVLALGSHLVWFAPVDRTDRTDWLRVAAAMAGVADGWPVPVGRPVPIQPLILRDGRLEPLDGDGTGRPWSGG